jgi:hypothetical protein
VARGARAAAWIQIFAEYTVNMANTEIQIVSIELWGEIESERETAYLLKSVATKDRLLQAAQRQTGLAFETAIEKLGI